MKKIMLIGKIGCGKTTLCQRLFYEDPQYKKTQAIEVIGNTAIDTPGEYIERKQFYKALIVTAVEADLILILHDCNDTQWSFSPRMNSMFNRPLIGVLTKIDLCDNPKQIDDIEELMHLAGAEKVFRISSVTGEGVDALRDFLNDGSPAPEA